MSCPACKGRLSHVKGCSQRNRVALPTPSPPAAPGPGDYESRYTWEYIDNVREFATRHGTLEQPQVVRLLELLEIGTRHRHGERPK